MAVTLKERNVKFNGSHKAIMIGYIFAANINVYF